MMKKQGWVGVDAPMDSSIVMGRVLTLEERMLRLERRVEEAEKAIPALVIQPEVSLDSDTITTDNGRLRGELIKARETIGDLLETIGELREKVGSLEDAFEGAMGTAKNQVKRADEWRSRFQEASKELKVVQDGLDSCRG